MTAFLIAMLVLFGLSLVGSLKWWLASPELPQPGRRTRRGVAIALVVETTLVVWAAALLWGGLMPPANPVRETAVSPLIQSASEGLVQILPMAECRGSLLGWEPCGYETSAKSR